MKLLLTLTALFLCMASCRDAQDPEPTLEEKLQGAWSREWIDIQNTYSFDNGQCLTYAIIPGHPVQFYAYAYTCQGDTLSMVDLASPANQRDVRRAVVEFPTDTTCVLGFVGGIKYFLTRI